MKSKLKTKGFTLIEVIVYIAVLSIVITTVISFLLWTMQANNKSGAIREVLNNEQRILAVITEEVRSAQSIYTPTTTSTQLSLETMNNIPDGEDMTYEDFYLASSTLFLKREEQDPIQLNSDDVLIKNLNFTIVSNTSTYPSVLISFEVDYKNPSNSPQYSASVSVTSSVSMRNY